MEPGFNPPSLNFNYLPHSGIVPNETVILVPAFIPDAFPAVIGKPDWLDVIYSGEERDSNNELVGFRYIISVKPSVADILGLGYFQGAVLMRYKQGLFNIKIEILPVLLRVLNYTQLAISPRSFTIAYNQGDTAPTARYMNIVASGPWSIAPNQNWLTFSSFNGSGNANVALYVDVAGLPLGTSHARFLVDDGRTQVTGDVFVIVTGETTEEYVIVNPIALEFSETRNQAPTDIRQFTIDSTIESTITTDVPWLALSQTAVDAGYSTITASTQNTQSLLVGMYPATITVSSAIGEKYIDVLLVISEKQFNNLINNGFYYAKDRNKLTGASSVQNAEVIINIKAQGESFGIKNYLRKIPYYRNILSTVIGLETDILLSPSELPPLETLFYKHISPVRYDLRISNRSLTTGFTENVATIENLNFINGKTPPSSSESEINLDVLTYLPPKFTAPLDGVIAFSIRTLTPPSCFVSIIRDGAVIVLPTIPVSVPNTNIYTGFISLKNYSLKVADRFIVKFGLFQVEAQIKPTELPTAQIIWENEWDCPEIFNASGIVQISLNDGSKTVVTSRDGKEYEKVIEAKSSKSFSITTGNLYSNAELEFLATIMDAKRIWIQIGKTRTPVIHNIRNAEIFKTRDFLPELDLKFKSAEV